MNDFGSVAAAALVSSAAVGCGGVAVVDDDARAEASCEPGNAEFSACGDAGVCFDGECCGGCWRVTCSNARCSLVCVPRVACD